MPQRSTRVVTSPDELVNSASTVQRAELLDNRVNVARWIVILAVVSLGLPLHAAEPAATTKSSTRVCDEKSQCAVFENKSSVRIYFQVNLGPGNCTTRKSFKNFSLEPGESDRIPVGGDWDNGETIPGGVDMAKRQTCYQLNNLDAVEKCLKDSVLPPTKLPPAVKGGHWCFSDEGAISSCSVCKRITRRNTVTD